MMEKPKPAKLFFIFAGICVIAIPFIIFTALSTGSQKPGSHTMGSQTMGSQTQNLDFDHNGAIIFAAHDDTTKAYMEGHSTSRTLNYYYSLRQYPGSPPYIVHPLEDEKGQPYECLSCHAKGGFTASMNRFAPVTPHPQQTYCQQCHVKPVTDKLFKETDWASVMPPRMGRSALAGSPPPIAHDIQMRENCIACHVGSGAVAVIQVAHSMRGNCRQCHVPELAKSIFQKTPKTEQ